MVRIVRGHRLEVMVATLDSDPGPLRQQVEGWKRHGVRMFAVSGHRFMRSSGCKTIVASLVPLHAAVAQHLEEEQAQGRGVT